MKLYYSPSACSLSPHIVLRELGSAFELVKVDLQTKRTADGRDFLTINPKGCVPTLELDSGETLTEGVAIVQYLADRSPEKGLLPPAGTIERARVQEYLNFIASELHKAFAPLFKGLPNDAAKQAAIGLLSKQIEHIEISLADGREWLAGSSFTPADVYAFVVLRWAPMLGISLENWPKVSAFVEKVAQRPSTLAAVSAE